MKTETLEQLVREIIPLLGTTWVDHGEAKDDWVKRVEKALAALTPPAPVAEPVVFPESPRICRCGHFESEGIECINCGGLLF